MYFSSGYYYTNEANLVFYHYFLIPLPFFHPFPVLGCSFHVNKCPLSNVTDWYKKQKKQDLIYLNKGWDLRSLIKQMLFLKLKVFMMIVTIETKLCKIFQTNTSLLASTATTAPCITLHPMVSYQPRIFSFWLFALNSNYKTGLL